MEGRELWYSKEYFTVHHKMMCLLGSTAGGGESNM